MSVTHASFSLERTYDAAPARVFRAFADPEAKARWFGGGDEQREEFDFRVGGRERSSGAIDGANHEFDCRYYDIVENERIVYAYSMHVDGSLLSVSTATIELRPAGDGTTLVLTESGAWLDGRDSVASREHGTAELLEALGRSLKETA
jgi:uncharacterized protein YndB with AHSA1/START domain